MSTRKESSKGQKRKAIAIVRPQQHVREEEEEEKITGTEKSEAPDNSVGESSRKNSDEKRDNEKLTTVAPSSDREARYSLYDFQSDSETEEKLSSSTAAANLNTSASAANSPNAKKNSAESSVPGNRNNNRKPFTFSSPKRPADSLESKRSSRASPNKPSSLSDNSLSCSSSDLAENSTQSSAVSAIQTTTTVTSSSSNSNVVKTTTATAASSSSSEAVTSEFQQPTAPAQFHPPQSTQNNDHPANTSRGSSDMHHLQSSHHCHDESGVGVTASSRDHRGDDNRSTDSGVSTIRSISGDERSGSRSSTVSDERSLRPSPYLPETSSTSPPTSAHSSHAHQSQSGRNSGPPSSVSGAASNPGAVWRDPALLAMHQARSAAAAGKIPHIGLHPAAAASMADHHRHQSGAPGGSQPPSASVMSAAAVSAAHQFSALQHYQARTITFPSLHNLGFLIARLDSNQLMFVSSGSDVKTHFAVKYRAASCHPSYTDKTLSRLTVWVLNGR